MQNTGHYFGTQQEYARMFEMIFGAHTSQIVHTAALYSLSEHLAEERNTPTEIAAVESLHVDATFRLMRLRGYRADDLRRPREVCGDPAA